MTTMSTIVTMIPIRMRTAPMMVPAIAMPRPGSPVLIWLSAMARRDADEDADALHEADQ